MAKPGAGTVAALTLRAIRHLLENTEYRAPGIVGAPSDDFSINTRFRFEALYDREKLLRGRLLYVELASFIDLLVDTGAVQITTLRHNRGTFSLAPAFPIPQPRPCACRGFNRLVEVRKYRRQLDVIRVPRVEDTDRGTTYSSEGATAIRRSQPDP